MKKRRYLILGPAFRRNQILYIVAHLKISLGSTYITCSFLHEHYVQDSAVPVLISLCGNVDAIT